MKTDLNWSSPSQQPAELESLRVQWAISGNIRRLKRKSVIGQAVLLALAIELLLFAAFTCLQLPVPTQHNLERYFFVETQHCLVHLPTKAVSQICQQVPAFLGPLPSVRYSAYVPVVPVAIFLGYVLGAPLGMAAVASFIFLGIIGPNLGFMPLASGGGLEYWRQPTCGYLIGMIGAAWFSGRITAVTVNSFRQLLAVLGSLTITHVLGLLYLFGASLGLLLFQGDGAFLKWQPWLFESVRNLSWYTLPYDALFSLALIGIGFPFRWLVSILTAPDIAMKPKSKWEENSLEQPMAEAVT